MTKEQKDGIRAAVRTLALLDGYLSQEPQESLTGWNGGMMTYAELRNHATSCREYLVAQFSCDLPNLSEEKP